MWKKNNYTFIKNIWYKGIPVNLYQTTNTGIQTCPSERVCRRQFWIRWKWWFFLLNGKKPCGKKDTLLLTSNFSFFHSVFKRDVLQIRKNRDLIRKVLMRASIDSRLADSRLTADSLSRQKYFFKRLNALSLKQLNRISQLILKYKIEKKIKDLFAKKIL